jgi:hypothetical protein
MATPFGRESVVSPVEMLANVSLSGEAKTAASDDHGEVTHS